jgi:transposase InsO family protein
MCRILSVSCSGFYKWLNHKQTKQEVKRNELTSTIKKIYNNHKGRIGSPKMHIELAEQGIKAGKNQVAEQMRKNNLRAITHKRFRVMTTDSKHDFPVAENLLNRTFTVEQPGKVLVSDITYIPTQAGWVYLTVFIDLFSRMVIGWALSSNIDTNMVLKALNKARINRNLQPGTMIHSDRGSQYASEAFRDALKDSGFVQSMSRKGNCWDNAVAESFFRIYKSELMYHCNFQNKKDVFQKTFEYIESYYNRQRRHGTLGYMTPAEFEMQFKKVA